MATAYRLNSDKGIISVSRSNDGSEVRVMMSNDESDSLTVATFDTTDFIRFMSTLQKNWGK